MTYEHFLVLTNSSYVFYGTISFIDNVRASLLNSAQEQQMFLLLFFEDFNQNKEHLGFCFIIMQIFF